MTKCLVLLSGGQDSCTCLFWAKKEFKEVHAVSFRYGQRHVESELRAAYKIAEMANVMTHVTLAIPTIQNIGDSALLNNMQTVVPDISNVREGTNLPSSFVPGRNIVFLTFAAMWAYKHKIDVLVGGMCQTDYSGYPDCREGFINSLQKTLRQGMDWETLEILTPMMHLTKAEEIKMARKLPGCWEALAYSHTCYEGVYPPCGVCPACLLRAKGFAEAGYIDPLLERYTKGE